MGVNALVAHVTTMRQAILPTLQLNPGYETFALEIRCLMRMQ
jgi:hypothetical protein